MRAALTLGPGNGRSLPMPDDWDAPPPLIYLHKSGDPGRHVSLRSSVLASAYRLGVDDKGSPCTLPNGEYAYWHSPGDDV